MSWFRLKPVPEPKWPEMDEQIPQMPKAFRPIIEDVIQQGDSNLDPEIHEEMIRVLFEQIDNIFISDLLDALKKSDADRAIQLLEAKRISEFQQFLASRVDLPQIMQSTISRFRELYAT